MKRLFMLMSLVAFIMAAPLAMAKDEPQINCCIKEKGKSKCEQMTKSECKKAKGKRVTDCKKCK